MSKKFDVAEHTKKQLYLKKVDFRQQAMDYYQQKPRHIFHEKGVKDTLHPERDLYGNRSMIEHDMLQDHRDDASRDSHRVKPNDRDTPPQFKKRPELESQQSTADSMKNNQAKSERFNPSDYTNVGVKVNGHGNVIADHHAHIPKSTVIPDTFPGYTPLTEVNFIPDNQSVASRRSRQPQIQNGEINLEDMRKDMYKGPDFSSNNEKKDNNVPTRSDFLMGGKPLMLADGRNNLNYGKRQYKDFRIGYRDEMEDLKNQPKKRMSRSFTVEPKQPQWRAHKQHAQDAMNAPKQKLRNGIDVEDLRPNNNMYKNHSLCYDVVNRQQDKSNVRNNSKVYCKNINEEFVPEPLYEDYNKDNNARNHMEIQTREEYADLQHFPRARRRYFDNTMQPNRFIFRNDRAQTRDPSKENDRNTLYHGGKGDTYVIDQTAHPNGTANFYPQRADDFYEGNDHQGMLNNEVLYSKRVGDIRLPPHTDMKNFSRTRQAYQDQDYIRARAAVTLKANPHRRKVIVPKRAQYAPHAREAGNPDLYHLTNKNADHEMNMPLGNDPKNYDNAPEYEANFDQPKKGLFTGGINNHEAYAKNFGHASRIKDQLNKGDALYQASDMPVDQIRVSKKNMFNNSINNREPFTKNTGTAKAVKSNMPLAGYTNQMTHKDNWNTSTPYMI